MCGAGLALQSCGFSRSLEMTGKSRSPAERDGSGATNRKGTRECVRREKCWPRRAGPALPNIDEAVATEKNRAGLKAGATKKSTSPLARRAEGGEEQPPAAGKDSVARARPRSAGTKWPENARRGCGTCKDQKYGIQVVREG
jgi:hypothetical protein